MSLLGRSTKGRAAGNSTEPGHDGIAARTTARRRSVRRQLYLLNALTGAGLGHLFFTLVIISVSPRLHELMFTAAATDPVSASLQASTMLMQPAYFLAGLVASAAGAAIGLAMAWFQVRVLDGAGELVRDAEFERSVARRTIDLTVHNQRMADLNARLAAAKSDLEARHRELRETQAKLVRSERLAAITETAVSVNHEINGPLMVILGQSELLLRDLRRVGRNDIATSPLAPPVPDGVALESRLRAIESQTLRIAEITRKLASLVEPVSATYLEDEGIRMVDLERSSVEADASMETVGT